MSTRRNQSAERVRRLTPRASQIIPKAPDLISLLAHETEQREKIIRPQIARRTRNLAFFRRLVGQSRRAVGEKLERRRKAHAIPCSQRLLGNLRSIEIPYRPRANDVELQH